MPLVSVNDVRLYCEAHGPDDAPVLVLNNGILMNAASSPMAGGRRQRCFRNVPF